jgi:hypothetical protein
MITFTGNLLDVFQSPEPTYFNTVKIMKRVNDVYVLFKATTTLDHNVTLSDGVEYIADRTLQAIDPFKIASIVNRESFKFVLADPLISWGSDAEQGLIGCKVEVRVCFIHPTTGAVLTDTDDTLLIYGGYIDEIAYSINTQEQGEVLLQIGCSSPLADLDQKNGIYLSKDVIRGRNPQDGCCDAVYLGSSHLQLKWGKA